jgi:hypothetical protein
VQRLLSGESVTIDGKFTKLKNIQIVPPALLTQTSRSILCVKGCVMLLSQRVVTPCHLQVSLGGEEGDGLEEVCGGAERGEVGRVQQTDTGPFHGRE